MAKRLMAKRQDLKSKLKAADRRRSRRSAPKQNQSSVASPQRKVDVASLIASTILEFIDASPNEVHDIAIVSAMRSCLNVSGSSGMHSLPLLQRLDAVQSRADVDTRGYRAALKQLLDEAARHRDADDPIAFIRYLDLLVK